MKTKLISITKPVYDELSTAEELIVYCARVSNPNNQLNNETAPRLINYCIKHGHWSIFEMASMCVEIKTSRAIAAQILRHKSFSFQEFSQRYSSVSNIEPIEIRKQGETNRQSSSEAFDPNLVTIIGDPNIPHAGKSKSASKAIDEYLNKGLELYEDLLSAGVARETARMVLPLTTETTMYMSGSARSWIHYFDVRCCEHTQKEHRDIAYSIRNLFKEEFPMISEALKYE